MTEVFFKGMLVDNENIHLKYEIETIEEDCKALFDNYLKDNFENTQAFSSILLNYQLVFL